MPRLRQTLSFDWGASPAYDAATHQRELNARVWWFIALRWLWVVACLLCAAAAWSFTEFFLTARLLLAAGLFLIATNLAYTTLNRRFCTLPVNRRGLQATIVAQTLTDFMSLALVSYALGGIESPVIVLFLAEIILLTLLLKRRTSLVMTLVGGGFAALPLVLESAGVVPGVSLYASALKPALSTRLDFTVTYCVAMVLFFLFCWYLVSEITTSLRRREHQLEETTEQLTRLDREKTQATLRATHELKAPLAAIKNYVYVLRDGYAGEIPPRAQEVLERIAERSDQLMAEIVDIIHLSNLKTQAYTQLRLEALNLTDFIAREVQEAAVLGRRRNIRIVNQAEKAPAYTICAAAEHLHTLIANVLHNAIQYSHPGGRVEVDLQAKRQHVSVLIRDYGIGIAEENIPKIFEEHFRASNAVRHHRDGTGLGLALVREAARLHHARLRVSSTLGEGTTFNITFPLIET